MDQCTREVRLQHWKNIICQCQCRPKEQAAKQWVDENGISEQTYYRWQRTIRQEAFTEMTAAEKVPAAPSQDTDVSFVEVPAHKAMPVMAPADRPAASAVIRTDAFTIELTDSISDRLLSAILREVSHAWRLYVSGPRCPGVWNRGPAQGDRRPCHDHRGQI